jgi:LytS/YehU family sensor histidine kinase
VENEALRAENITTHYEALKSQLDPHFMFNSLNTLQSLISVDAEKAQYYVQELSQALRFTLQNKEVLTLQQELQGVQAYCNLIQIRYGDNLHFDFQVDSKFNDYQVLPLSVQGLVENAIKHNVISGKQPLEISVVTTEDGFLKVSNPIQPKIMDEPGNGIGLANLTERYRLKWDKNVEIVNDGHVFMVTLPLVEPKA